MCPKPLQHQRGFLMPLAIFILVVMGLFAISLSRMSAQATTSAAQEIVNLQAFYAAESGAQRGMRALFYTTGATLLTRQGTDGRCGTTTNVTHNFGAITGLNNCTAVVTCTCTYESGNACSSGTNANYSSTSSVVNSYYKITSVGTCGTGTMSAVRTIEVGSFIEQE